MSLFKLKALSHCTVFIVLFWETITDVSDLIAVYAMSPNFTEVTSRHNSVAYWSDLFGQSTFCHVCG